MKPILGDIVFFFGAGASYGATVGHIRPHSPPLTAELYDRLATRFPTEWGPRSRRAVHADQYRKDFEKAFTELDLGQAPHFPPGTPGASGLDAIEAQRPLAVYFSELCLDGAQRDYYSRLLNYLRQSDMSEGCFFSTLNYECLFEQASVRTGFQVAYLLEAAAARLRGLTGDDWPGPRQSANTVPLAKLHGSCNFTTRATREARVRLSCPSTAVESEIDTRDPCTPLTERDALRILPIMTQISQRRGDALAPAQIQQIRQIWAQAISGASLIVVVGVAPRLYDAHVWGPLREATGDLVYIGGASDLDSWRECNHRFRPLGPTFDEGFRPLLMCLAAHEWRRGGGLWGYLVDTCRALLA
jgi:hypothetical protein